MNIVPMFATPIGVANGSHLIAEANSLYDAGLSKYKSKEGFSTSLSNYSLEPRTTPRLPAPQLEAFIKLQAHIYAEQLGYNVSKYEIEVSRMWLTEIAAGQHVKPHSHLGNNFSGVFIVALPPGANGTTFHGPLSRFDANKLDMTYQTVFTATQWNAQAKEGDLYIWDSYIFHEMKPGEYEGVRRSIAFDVRFLPKEQ